jgi:hypothetical protein
MPGRTHVIHQTKMVVNVYSVLLDRVESGVLRGWNRAHKHTNTPDEETIKDEILNAIMGDICEYFKFEP